MTDTDWNPTTLATFADAEEVQISSTRPDGTLRPFVIIWGVRAGDDFYVRSAYGTENGWFRRAVASGTGALRAGSVEQAVRFEPAPDAAQPAIDAAYLEKYARYTKIVAGIVGPDWWPVTLRLVPARSA